MPDLVDRLKAALADRYAVERELGRGGMAAVYLAEDLKHGRKVAVKVLHPELAATLGPDRFLREIGIAARLTHPHILPLLDSGEAGGFVYYVMPYIEGNSLRGRLVKEHELPVNEVVRILRDVVDALAEAHQNGVVHRDIKPDNVLIRGHHALVTDFGVAKAVSEATGRQGLTTAGVALGTPAYMAPEQAAADPSVDHRADIYAVGVMAYEMLTGKVPFDGSPAAILASHVTEVPTPVTNHRATVPPGLAAVVMKCLEKKPADRWQSAADLLTQLEGLVTPGGGTTPTDTRPIAAIATRRSTPFRLVLASVGVAIAALLVWRTLRSAEQPLVLDRTTQITDAPGLEFEPALSGDGKLLAWTTGLLGSTHIYVRQVAGGRALELTEGLPGSHRAPHWSGDGSQIVFQSTTPSGNFISVLPALGGIVRHLIDAPLIEPLRSPAWSPDGSQLAYSKGDTVYVAAADGTGPRLVTVANQPAYLAWSPDGGRLAYVVGNAEPFNAAPSSVWVVSSQGGQPLQIASNAYANLSPSWLPGGGGLVFISNRDGTPDLYTVTMSRSSGVPTGAPTRLTTGLGAQTVAVSADGLRIAYAVLNSRSSIWKTPIPTGSVPKPPSLQQVISGNQLIGNFDVSPDGRWLAFDSDRSGNQDIYRIPTNGGEPERLTMDPADDFSPSVSPDGREIAFHSFRSGSRDVFVMSADGKTVGQVTETPAQDRGPTWSPDGKEIAFWSDRTGRYQLYSVRRDGTGWGLPHQLTSIGTASGGQWSPDGRLISFGCELPRGTICMAPADGGDVLRVAPSLRALSSSATGAGRARWSSDSRTLFLVAADTLGRSGLWSVPINGAVPQLRIGDWPGGGNLVTDGVNFYFTISERESDIWTVEVKQ